MLCALGANAASPRRKLQRLRHQADIGRVFAQGQRFRGQLLTTIVLKQPIQEGQPSCRGAFLVSRRVARKAVARNRLRRQLREALRQLVRQHRLATSADVIVLAAPQAAEAEYAALAKEMEFLLKRAGLWAAPDHAPGGCEQSLC